jgi:hypothetical protein
VTAFLFLSVSAKAGADLRQRLPLAFIAKAIATDRITSGPCKSSVDGEAQAFPAEIKSRPISGTEIHTVIHPA